MEQIILGTFTEEILNDILIESSHTADTGDRINFFSRQFLNIPYRESTLIGGRDTPEAFVVNLEGLDCFTFLDYVEAGRLSGSFTEFKERLRAVRYQSGTVTFEKRNHFFTDWREYHADRVDDITAGISAGKSRRVTKCLNDRGDGTFFVPGIIPVKRELSYIPSESLDEKITGSLKTGDYAGVYADRPGLDVSHVGIIIRHDDGMLLRHASSRQHKVVDEDLTQYVNDKPGIIVLRPKDQVSS